MKFDVYYESMMNQLEFDYEKIPSWNKKIPMWAKELGDLWDTTYKSKYYPIKNMQKGFRKDAAFRKFWTAIIKILKGKGLSNSRLIALGIPEYMFNLYH
jgi:hypothetical protein